MFKVLRSDGKQGFETFKVPFTEGMRLLDGLRYIQQNIDQTLSFRWNCREGICGSCAARLNGKPVLTCKTPVEKGQTIVLEPLKTLDVVKDLVVNIAKAEEKVSKLKPYFKGKKSSTFRTLYDEQIEDAEEMRSCISCYICYDSCHVLRDGKKEFLGPKHFVQLVGLDKHPDEKIERIPKLKDNVWMCNNSRCCTETCPQDIKVNENAMVYAKERAFEEGASE